MKVYRAIRLPLLGTLLALLAACASGPAQQPAPAPRQEPPKPPAVRIPSPRQPIQAPAPAPRQTPQVQRSHPRYAPPPGAPSHWDGQLGVYVIEGSNLYYRERLYYRRDGGAWYCSGRPGGPWEPVGLENVPPGLRSR